MDFLNSWLPWLVGLGGISLTAIYLLGGMAILGTANSALSILGPIVTGAKDFISWYFSNLWDGIKVVMANSSTFLVIGTVAAFTGYATMKNVQTKCDANFKAAVDAYNKLKADMDKPKSKRHSFGVH